MVVLGTTDAKAALGTGVKAVGNGGVVGAASHAHGLRQNTTVAAISVTSHQVPRTIARTSAELLSPGVVNVDGETVSGAAGLSLVTAAGHVAVSGLCARSGSSVGTPTLAAVFGSCIFVA